MSAVGQNALGLPLQDSNEMDGVSIALVLIPLDFGKLAFIALFGKLVNSCLNVGSGPELNNLPGIIEGQRVAKGLEQTVENRRGQSLAHDFTGRSAVFGAVSSARMEYP
jgi:hypothetical protein